MNIPTQDREDDKETLTKEKVLEENRKEEEKMHNHENSNPNLGKGHNPIHHDQGNR